MLVDRQRLLALGVWSAALFAGFEASAHVRIVVESNGNGLFWPGSTSTSIAFQAVGSDDIPDDSDEIAVRNAIAVWNGVLGSNFTLVEDTSDATQARTDWQTDSLHLVWFDEDNSSGYFPGGAGVVALTPLWFFASGSITDADIIFNGQTYGFTTEGTPGRFDVQDVAAHEIGHFLGLDHSGYTGATMYPYVDPAVILHRSLALDDRNGLRTIYPAGSFASLTGRVERSDSSAVVRAHVVALDDQGRTAGAALADASGNFVIGGLDAGTYTVYADPFDNPVSAANLTGNFAVDVDYQTTFYSGSTTLAASETANLGTLTVNADTALQLGRSSNRLPRRATIGQSTAHSLNGSGLSSGSTLTVSDPDLTVSSVSWFGSVVSFTVTVPPGESPGHVDVIVENASGDVDRLVAGIELAPPDPVVSSVAPTIASPDGGTSLTISGSNFRAGARVVIGDRVYEDGDANGTTVVDAATITLTTAATVDGTHDVVVIDETGVEGRAADGLMVTEVPALATVFPVAGEVGGGTTVRLLGDDFVDGAQVFFGGVLAASVMVVDETRIDAVTPSSAGTGSVSVQVVNPGGLSSASSFTYTLTADPTLASLTPATGATAGGDTITLSGSDFDGDTQVRFGVDPLDGTGGTAAASVTLIDAATLEVVTPAGSGSVAVMVTDGGTGQADVLEAGFTYSSSDGGGGGGCGSIATPGPGTWRDAIGNAGWAALLLLFALVHRARSLRRTAPLAS